MRCKRPCLGMSRLLPGILNIDTMRIKRVLLFVGIVFLSSCQKVIDVNLNSANPKLVVDANLDSKSNSCSIKLSKTVNFNESNVFPAEQNALVVLSNSNGNKDTLMESMPGQYGKKMNLFFNNSDYLLTIKTLDGSVYKSSSTLKTPVKIDTVLVVKTVFGFRRDVNYALQVQFMDDVAETNYYQFKVYLNGVKSSTVRVRSDELFNGKQAKIFVRLDNSKDIKSGDLCTLEVVNIDKGVYTYYYGLNQLGSGPNGSATPANPKSNVSGGCLGYFSANASTLYEVVIP